MISRYSLEGYDVVGTKDRLELFSMHFGRDRRFERRLPLGHDPQAPWLKYGVQKFTPLTPSNIRFRRLGRSSRPREGLLTIGSDQ